MSELTVVVRTPAALVLQQAASSLRLPTESGAVGIRPGAEPTLLAVEPGLLLIRRGADLTFVGTVGGLLSCDGHTAIMLTPLAVTGAGEDEVLARLDRALAVPPREMAAREQLQRLQEMVLDELLARNPVHVPRPGRTP